MKLYCYLFRTDGTVEKEVINCRKNKDCYAFKRNGSLYEYIDYVDFKDIGKIKNNCSEQDDSRYGCKMYLEKNVEITEKMIEFSKKRASEIKSFQKARKKLYDETQKLCSEFEMEGFLND